ncbi:hypothetical protein [Psychrobacter immobilis]|uniref:hypothetical protein n=1 Tax=Psychrobacter immobilis TaxID=498 RepID=UPI001917E8EB|nr:hypothetical protein [Psychrobacter immobilis]
MTDTARVLKSPLTPIQHLMSRLSTSTRMIVACMLGLVAGLITHSGFFNILHVFLFFMIFVVALTINLLNRMIKIGTFISFLFGALLVGLYPHSGLGSKLYILTVIAIIAWAFIIGCAKYALSRPETYFNYFNNTVLWVLIFTVSWLVKAMIIINIAITVTAIVKIFQLLLTNDWTVKHAKAYAFSVLLPSMLTVSFFAYSHKAQNTDLGSSYNEAVRQMIINTVE